MKVGIIRTYSGVTFDVRHPVPSMIRIEDLAHQLSLECRWGGACKRHYSVAEHSMWVAKFARKLCPRPEATVHALLHDAHEAYIKDIQTPVKRILGEVYEDLASGIDAAVFAKFEIGYPDDEVKGAVKQADQYCAWTEAQALCPEGPEVCAQSPPKGLADQVGMMDVLVNEAGFSTSFNEALWRRGLEYALRELGHHI